MHVESEVVLKCEKEKKTKKARATCCAGCENDCFVTHTVNPDSMTQVFSHRRKITSAGLRRMRGLKM